jgi:hypothetical protein
MVVHAIFEKNRGCVVIDHRASFLLTTLISPVAEVVFLSSAAPCSTPFSFDCNKLVRSDPRGLSIANGKGSVITFRISVTPIGEDEEVPTIFSSGSCTFASVGAKVEDFRFLGAESFGSTEFFCSWKHPSICLFQWIALPAFSKYLQYSFSLFPQLLCQAFRSPDTQSQGRPLPGSTFISSEYQRQLSSIDPPSSYSSQGSHCTLSLSFPTIRHRGR